MLRFAEVSMRVHDRCLLIYNEIRRYENFCGQGKLRLVLSGVTCLIGWLEKVRRGWLLKKSPTKIARIFSILELQTIFLAELLLN